MNEQIIKRPRALKPGDKIGIFSPSEPIVGDRIDRLKSGIKLLERLGFKAVLSPNIFKKRYYMAGTVEERANDFNNLIHDDDIAMIMASWGGKSSNQLLDYIDYNAISSNPKLICGFSDPTNFLNAIYAKTGIPTLYGPDVVGKLIEDPEEDILRFKSLISNGEKLIYDGEGIKNSSVIRGGATEGILIGGNLSCFIIGILGTSYQPPLNKAILFFEAANLKPRDFHQMLTYLKHYGAFEKIAGMVVGYIGGADSRPWANRAYQEIVAEEISDYNFPVLSLPIFGHGNCPKAPIPIGIHAKLDADALTLSLLDTLVKNKGGVE